MSQFTSFDGLPLIVHDLILRSLPSPKDVANVIRASPGSLHAFRTGRRSILLGVMRNFLSPENQHLMNLVMAAPHFYHHRQLTEPMDKELTKLTRQSECDSPACNVFNSPGEFNQAFDEYVGNRGRRPLTLDTFDYFIKLYAVFGRAITGYALFTLARGEYRVPKLSTPEASKIRYHFTDCHLRTPDDEETSRVWRGFLFYELTCLMYGVPQMMAAASNQSYHAPGELEDMSISFYEIPTYVREEAMCVQQYVQEQYELSFNELMESFEVAVGGIGHQTLEASPSPTDSIMPLVDLEWKELQEPVQYLFEPPFYYPNPWTTSMTALGISFLQEFLSWDASTQLDFIRITYPFLSNWEQCPISILGADIDVDDLRARSFGWCDEFVESFERDVSVDHFVQSRLRSVGWIFWSNSDRLSYLNLDEDEVNGSYGWKGCINHHLRLQGRPHLLEKLVNTQEWKPILQYFGPSFSENQLNDIKGLFISTGDLKSSSVTDIVSALRCQDEEDAPAEAQEKGD